MAKALVKITGHAHVSSKIHSHLKKQGQAGVSLKDIQKRLSNIGISLSKRVIEERAARQLMSFFIDTSAFFKRYQPEQGTELVCKILEESGQPVFISSISIIEIVSNLKRLFEIDKITTEEQFRQQRTFFYQDINNLGITVLDVTAEDIIKADTLIMKRYMKPIDGIQLAIALNLEHDDLTFVSSDQRLCNIAEIEGVTILIP